MDYSKFNVEDFASNESFIKWVNCPDKETEEFWKVFILTHPELTGKIDKARILVINLHRAEVMTHDQKRIDTMWGSIRDRVEASEPTQPSNRPRKSFRLYSVMALASLTLVCLAIWYFQPSSSLHDFTRYSDQEATSGYVEQVNETGAPIKILLGDGSVVSLENNGRIKYKSTYESDSTRDVYLLGEAFFEVTKNPFKPFLVHSNEIVTEVLGTSFRVQANRGEKNVVVSVKTGKVSVYAMPKNTSSNTKRNGVILLPNQQVSYERELQSFSKKLVEAPEVLPQTAPKNNFVFENAPMDEVFKTLQEAYGIEILFNGETMKNCFLTAPLGSEPLFEKLKIICRTIGATYEIIDTKVVISSNGC